MKFGPIDLRQALLRFSTSLALSAAIAAELARMSADTSAQAADLGLSSLLIVLLPLSLAFALVPFDPEPTGPLVVLGESRKRIVLRSWLALALGIGLSSAAISGGVLCWTRTVSDPKLSQDLQVSLPIALGAALATFSLFLAARAWIGKWGLGLVLVLSWTLGQSDVAARALLPAGHVRHLLGVGEPLAMNPSLSALSLVLFCAAFLLVLLKRVPS